MDTYDVMIVEDDPMVAELNRRYVEIVSGFRVCAVAHSASEALQILDRMPVSLVLLDIFMPGMNGLDFFTKIRFKGKGVDVIVITAASDKQTIMSALRFGAIDYIIKPFEFERLSDALEKFRGLVHGLQEQETLNQEILDKARSKSLAPQPIPKGIDRKTLQHVWEQIRPLRQQPFSTGEIAARAGISRVSMRKYLEFLQSIYVLDVEVVYCMVGRPIYKYHAVYGVADQIVRKYL